jgi:replicative DNA helicase
VADKVLRLADDLGCPVVCLGQQNDDGKVRESRRWFNNCHIELRLQRRDEVGKENVVDLHITKARDGITGTVPLLFDGEHQMFLSYSGAIEGY